MTVELKSGDKSQMCWDGDFPAYAGVEARAGEPMTATARIATASSRGTRRHDRDSALESTPAAARPDV
jgi:hypothetical protein